jgi:hypothetical protein
MMPWPMTVPIMLAFAALSNWPAHAAEPTETLTLACKGVETARGGAGTSTEEIDIGVIVDFSEEGGHWFE